MGDAMREKPPVWNLEPDYRDEIGRIAMRHFAKRRWWRSLDWELLWASAMYTICGFVLLYGAVQISLAIFGGK